MEETWLTSSRRQRIIFFVFNAIIFVCGLIIVGEGYHMLKDKTFLEEFLHSVFYDASNCLVITSGMILISVPLTGVIAYLSKRKWLTLICLVMLLVSVMFLAAGWTLGFLSLKQMKSNMDHQMGNYIEQYETVERAKMIWDKVQNDWECCGIKGRGDWKKIPASCCGNYSNCAGCMEKIEHHIFSLIHCTQVAVLLTVVCCAVFAIYTDSLIVHHQ